MAVPAMFLAAVAAGADTPPPGATGFENRLGLTFSPDGTRAYWVEWNGSWGSDDRSTRHIYMSRLDDGAWSDPVRAPFSGDYSDDDPFVSPDDRWLYFVSERPADGADTGNADIWRYGLAEESPPERLSVNSPAAEYSPVIVESGALYFASASGVGPGRGDLYRAEPDAEGFGTPVPLGPALNSPTGEWNLWVSADESEIVFEASSRPTNVSTPGDLYYSWRTAAGWTSAVPVDALNTPGSDLMPRMHPDGRTLYYTNAPIGGNARMLSADWAALGKELRAAYAPALMVANRSSHEIAFVDLSAAEVVARIPTGDGPHLMSNVAGGRVAATGYGEFPEPHKGPVTRRLPFVENPNSRLTLIDVADRTTLLETTLEDCTKPHHSWIVGQRVYATCESDRSVLVTDAGDGRTLGRIGTMQDGSHVLAFDTESRTLAVSNTQSGSVTLIRIDDGRTDVVELAAGSEGVQAIDGRFWIGNAIDGSVSVVDPAAAAEVRRIEGVCGFPIALSPDVYGLVWIACFASSELVAIDGERFAVTRRIALADPPLHVLVHPVRSLAYVSLPRQNAVAEIDLTSGEELRRFRVGIEPDGLRWAG